MKTNMLVVVLCLCTLVAQLPSLAHRKPLKEEQPHGLHLAKGRKVAYIPFKTYGNLVVVPVIINQSDTLRFILDTGVSTTLLTDTAVARKLALKVIRPMVIEGVGEGQSITAGITVGNRIKIGGLESLYHNIVVLPNQSMGLSEYMGAPIHGVFGHELFSKFVVTLDFQRQIMVVRPPEQYQYSSKQGDRFPISVERYRPYLEDVTVISNQREEKLRVVIDTGAGHALMFNTHQANISPPPNSLYTQLGVGLAGPIHGHIGRVPRVRIGKYELQEVIATFPDSVAFGAKIKPNEKRRDANLGGEFLQRFKVTFNYTDGYIVLKPNRKFFHSSFEHDMSGIDFVAQGDGFDQYYIQRVVIGSPAAKAGLQIGDQILSINGIQANEINSEGLRKIFQDREGKDIKVRIRRHDKVLTTNFTLKRII